MHSVEEFPSRTDALTKSYPLIDTFCTSVVPKVSHCLTVVLKRSLALSAISFKTAVLKGRLSVHTTSFWTDVLK